MVNFEEFLYYDKTAFFLFLGFFFYPFVQCFNFIWIPYISEKLTSKICK